ncbi:MAG: hypothetical protein CMJ47_06705 [Planctomyces sp.]|nr:hypothetical protein [Planctomyces sp.]
MFQVAEITTLEELQTYRITWEDLWGRGREKRFSTSYHWMETYFKNHPEREPKVLVVTLAGKTIGILPLCVKQVATKLGPLRILTYPLDGWGCWYGPIGPNSAATLTAGMRYLTTSHRDWGLIDLPYIDRDRHDLGRTRTAARNMGWSTSERVWDDITLIELSGSWSDFLEAKRSDVMDEILASEALLAKAGHVDFLRYRSGDTVGSEQFTNASCDDLLRHYRKLLEQAGRHTDWHEVEDFAAAAEHRNVLDLCCLLIDGRPVAATLGTMSGNTLETVRSVVVPQAGVETSDTESVLWGRLLEDSLLRGDLACEVCPECESAVVAASRWSTAIMQSFRYSMAPWSHLRSSLLVKYHALKSKPIPRRQQPRPLTQPVPAVATSGPQLRVFG